VIQNDTVWPEEIAHARVDVGSKPLVQVDLTLAGVTPAGNGGEVKKA
jgi:hypothetical protein